MTPPGQTAPGVTPTGQTAPAKFLLTLEPTADEIVLGNIEVQPTSDDPADIASAEFTQEIMKRLPPIAARVWKGHTNLGYPVEVAIVKIVKMEAPDYERLVKACREPNKLPSSFPEPERGDPA